MNETTDLRAIESPRRHAWDHVAIVYDYEAAIDAPEFESMSLRKLLKRVVAASKFMAGRYR
jgi:hypothetical protein